MSTIPESGKRVTLMLSDEAADNIKKLSKHFHITQWELMEFVCKQVSITMPGLAEHANSVRSEKLSFRSKKKEQRAKLRKFTPEEIEAALAALEKEERADEAGKW